MSLVHSRDQPTCMRLTTRGNVVDPGPLRGRSAPSRQLVDSSGIRSRRSDGGSRTVQPGRAGFARIGLGSFLGLAHAPVPVPPGRGSPRKSRTIGSHASSALDLLPVLALQVEPEPTLVAVRVGHVHAVITNAPGRAQLGSLELRVVVKIFHTAAVANGGNSRHASMAASTLSSSMLSSPGSLRRTLPSSLVSGSGTSTPVLAHALRPFDVLLLRIRPCRIACGIAGGVAGGVTATAAGGQAEQQEGYGHEHREPSPWHDP
jgi:hypothetical protein